MDRRGLTKGLRRTSERRSRDGEEGKPFFREDGGGETRFTTFIRFLNIYFVCIVRFIYLFVANAFVGETIWV